MIKDIDMGYVLYLTNLISDDLNFKIILSLLHVNRRCVSVYDHLVKYNQTDLGYRAIQKRLYELVKSEMIEKNNIEYSLTPLGSLVFFAVTNLKTLIKQMPNN